VAVEAVADTATRRSTMQEVMGQDTTAGSGNGRNWAELIRARLAGTVPRHDPDHWLMPGRFDSQGWRHSVPRDPIPAAVLIPLVERPELTVLFTQRATQLRNHAGQISFPGGRIEPEDGTPASAALREAREEIGLDERFVSIIGYLPDHVVITGFRITPVVAFVQPGFELLLASDEVEDTFEVPLKYLFDPANHRLQRYRSVTGEEGEFREIPFGERRIWGATAGMLLTLYRMCVGTGAP